MTTADTVFVVMAIVDGIALAIMVYIAVRLLETGKKVQRRAGPAIQEARSIAGTGKALADQVRGDGEAMNRRVREVAGRVRRRLENTRHIVSELRPGGRETPAGAVVGAARNARALGDMTRRLGRIKSAADAAAAASKRPS